MVPSSLPLNSEISNIFWTFLILIFLNSGFYTFQSIGDEEENPVISDSTGDLNGRPSFIPRSLTNLNVIEELENISCITDMKVDDLTGEGHPQVNLSSSCVP